MKLLLLSLTGVFILCSVSGCGDANSRKKVNPSVSKQKLDSSALRSETKKEIIEDSEDGSLDFKVRVKNWNSDNKSNSVNVQSDNVYVEKRVGKTVESSAPIHVKKDVILAVPPGSLARKIMDTENIYHWRPKWRYHGVGKPWLAAIALSSDRSVLALVETVGDNDGPKGSRIVYLNTYDCSIPRIDFYPKKKITNITFVPGKARLIASSEHQPSLKQANELLTLNCRSGKIVSSSKAVKTPISALVCDRNGEKLFVKPSTNNFMYIFSVRKISRKPLRVETLNKTGALAVSPDNTEISLAGTEGIESFNLDGESNSKTMSLPAKFAPELLIYCGKSALACMERHKAAYFIFNGQCRSISDMVANNILYHADEDEQSIVLSLKKNEIKSYLMPELQENEKIRYAVMKPNTKVGALFLGYMEKRTRYIVVDLHGNIYQLFKPGRKWKKRLILSPKR